MSAEEWAADIQFVVSECNRFQKDMERLGASAWIRSLSQADALSWLPRSDGKGSIICGAAAKRRLQHLSNTAIRHSDAYGTLTSARVMRHLEIIIVDRFLSDRLPLDIPHVQRALHAAVREAKRARTNTTHFIPCRISSSSEPESFAVGPIVFRPLLGFYARLQPHLNLLDRHSSEEGEYASRAWAEIEGYYSEFNWVAEVQVLNCDPDISTDRALQGVTAAIDVIQVVFGVAFSERMAAGGPARGKDTRALVRLLTGEQLAFSRSWKSTSSVSLTNLKGIVDAPEIVSLLDSGGWAIDTIVDPSLDRPLANRLIDAMSWYGQAVREDSDAGRIVKSVTALERLLLTNERDEKQATVSERGAALACLPGSRFDLAGWRERLKLAYGIRSKLVHGSISPFDPEVRLRAKWCVTLCEDVLKAGLHAFKAIGALNAVGSDKNLGVWFEELIALRVRESREGDDTSTI